MKILVDADACPAVIKDILFRAAKRAEVETILLANHFLSVPPSPWIKFVQVQPGFDIADDEIVKKVAAGDLVITADIPLANDVLEAGGKVLSPRGEVYTLSNIKARLTMRDFMESLRSSGVQTGGPAAMSQADRRAFANELDKYLAKLK